MSGLIFAAILAVPIIVALYLLLKPVVRQSRRKRLRALPSPAGLTETLERKVPLYSAMPQPLQQQLLGHVNVFLAEKEFIGCNGQQINDDIRYIVAGTACVLLLNRKAHYFPGFSSILIYPDSFESVVTTYDGMVEANQRITRAGESWHRGPIVLSWGDVLRGVEDPVDGFNVVLHEFAHKLDEQVGGTNGTPDLHKADHYDEWAAVLTNEYGALEKRVAKRKNVVLDEYALVSPAEFFAVATESFFEKPDKMKKRLPDLYDQLQRYYCVDPVSWRI